MKPSQFIINTDYPTLKNETHVSANGTIPSSQVIAGGGYYSLTGNVNVGSLGSLARGRIASTKNFTQYYAGQSILFHRTGTVGGSPFGYDIFALMFRVSATTLRFQIYIPNPYGSTLTCEAGTETIYFYANIFNAPYA